MKRIYADISQQRRMWRKFDVLKTKFDVGMVSEYNCFFVYLWSLNNMNARALYKVRVNCVKNKHFGEAFIYKKGNLIYSDYYEESIKILKAL